MLLNNDVFKNKDKEILKKPFLKYVFRFIIQGFAPNDKLIKILLGNKCIHNDIS